MRGLIKPRAVSEDDQAEKTAAVLLFGTNRRGCRSCSLLLLLGVPKKVGASATAGGAEASKIQSHLVDKKGEKYPQVLSPT